LDPWIADLTSEVLWAPDVGSARDAFRRFAAGAGIEFYAYGKNAAAKDCVDYAYLDSSYPEQWWQRYVEARYFEFDPVVIESERNPLPFTWRFVANRGDLTARQRRLFDEAAEFGIVHGLTIPFHGWEGRTGLLCFAFGSAKRHREAMAAQPNLRLLALYYHAAIERLLEAEEATSTGLSAMERQCLTWTAAGRSLWEISVGLHRAEADVAGALAMARAKLGTITTDQAVAKAVACGIILP